MCVKIHQNVVISFGDIFISAYQTYKILHKKFFLDLYILPIDFTCHICYNETGYIFYDNGDVFNIISEYEKIKHEQIL